MSTERPPLPYGPWWTAYQRLVVGDDELPLVPVALAFSHIVQGGEPWPQAEPRLRELEQEATGRARGRPPSPAARAIVSLLAERGFQGDGDHYEDPANSLLDRVIERGRGLPISLSVLAIHLARHAGVPLQGVGFPGHFLV
ncbi:MAG: transglutaminase-like domain-containing protein, partial [Nannocystaceae bacterium]